MAFTRRSLNEFKSTVADNALRKSRFDVTFTVPETLLEIIPPDINRELTLRCDSVDIPGIQVLTTNLKYYGGAHTLKIPNSKAFDEIRLQFIASKTAKEVEVFDRWIGTISDRNTNEVSYYDNIKTDFNISIYNEEERSLITAADSTIIFDTPDVSTRPDGNVVKDRSFLAYKILVLNAIPLRIDPISVSWGDPEDVMRFSVLFSYESLDAEYPGVSSDKLSERLAKARRILSTVGRVPLPAGGNEVTNRISGIIR